MSIRYLTIPDPVLIGESTPGTQLLWSFAEAVAFIVDTQPVFQAPQSNVRAGARLVEALAAVMPGTTVELRELDWKMLEELVERAVPWGSWLELARDDAGTITGSTPKQLPARRFLSFADAVQNATTTKGTSHV